MVRLPGDASEKPVDADDARDHPDRDPGLLEHGALLDVKLDVAVQAGLPACSCQRGRLTAGGLERLGKAASVGVNQREMLLVERAHDGAAAEAAQAEVVRLLSEEIDHDEVVVELGA
jgi:hypothetical protein